MSLKRESIMRTRAENSGAVGSTDHQGLLFSFGETTPEGASPASTNGRRERATQARAAAFRRSAAPAAENLAELLETAIRGLDERLKQIEVALESLRQQLFTKAVVKEFYTTAEIAQILNRRPYTVREWCRLGRIRAEKAHSGRGLDDEWRVSHDELVRFQNEGLLAIEKISRVAAPRRLVP
jgi:hypothetical protein